VGCGLSTPTALRYECDRPGALGVNFSSGPLISRKSSKFLLARRIPNEEKTSNIPVTTSARVTSDDNDAATGQAVQL
jgi:hypothetical protein